MAHNQESVEIISRINKNAEQQTKQKKKSEREPHGRGKTGLDTTEKLEKTLTPCGELESREKLCVLCRFSVRLSFFSLIDFKIAN